jgi:hypothetical protein
MEKYICKALHVQNGCWKHHQYRHCTTFDDQHHGRQEPWSIEEE